MGYLPTLNHGLGLALRFLHRQRTSLGVDDDEYQQLELALIAVELVRDWFALTGDDEQLLPTKQR